MAIARLRPFVVLASAALVALATTVPAAAAPPPGKGPPPVRQHPHQAVCADDGPGTARCFAHVRTDAAGAAPARTHGGASPDVLGNGGAYDPGYLQSAYNLASAIAAGGGAGKTVAIVDAYDDRTAAQDLGYYRSYFGLPACTTASGCFTKVNQYGQTNRLPPANTGWSQEISLDLDIVSAVCPSCRILLVEANSNSYSDLAAAVDYAARVPGVVAISNSYGGSEFSTETSAESHYNHPGIAVTVSSGDAGYGVEFPAASRYVTAVGGTSLLQDGTTGRGWTESVWSGAGAGCSAYVPKPAWQTDAGCARRTVADVAAVADPNTGVWVYYNGGWYIFGGTSVASPVVASVYALAGNTAALTAGSASYANAGALYDVTSGSDGGCGTYLCTGAAGYDGPTGNGTPNGVGGF